MNPPPSVRTAAPLDVFGCPLAGTQLIEASAGTGKTWAICGLVLRLLLEGGLEVRQILVVTFTNAATAELRERIRSRIVQVLAVLRDRGPSEPDAFIDALLQRQRTLVGLDDPTMVLRLERALQHFDEAAIFTIHGFCHRALSDAAFSAGVPATLELLADDRELRLQAVHDFWRRRIAGDTLPAALAAHLLQRKDSPALYARWLERRLAKPLSTVLWPPGIDAPPAVDGSALQALHDQARARWRAERAAVLAIVDQALPRLPANVYKPATLAQAALEWDHALAGSDALAAPAGGKKLDLLTPARLKPKKNQAAPEAHPFFALAAGWLAAQRAAREALALQRLQLLRELLDSGPPALREAKRQRRVLAFDDILLDLHERLHGEDAAALVAALRARFPAALVDEFQDTDPLQFAIFHTLYGGRPAPLFLVGDPKQAIYGFRSADLHTYLAARRHAAAEYTLAENQRSTRPLIRGLNALFGAHPRAFMLDGLDFHPVAFGAKPRAALLDRSAAPRAALQLWQLPGAAAGQPLRKDDAKAAALAACAGEIARLLQAAMAGEITLAGRPLAAGDIAVLVRSHAHGRAARQALAARGVGSVERSMASVFHGIDAEELAGVLAAILEPAREGLLRAALATTLLGRDAAAIAALDDDEAALLAQMARQAEDRQTWLQRGVGVMLRRWLVREQVAERLLARADGERRLTNLLHLSEALHEAAQQHAAPEALLRWLQAQRAGEAGAGGDAAQLRLESDRDLVQIVTIHKSKGLEYPFVFCPLLFDHPKAPPRGELEGQEWHDEDGRHLIDLRGDDALDPALATRRKARVRVEYAAEQLRLVYVALTRAVHRCHLVVGPYLQARGGSLSPNDSGRALLNWLVAGQASTPEQWLASSPPPPAPALLEAAWAQLAASVPSAAADGAPAVALAPLPAADALPAMLARPPAPALAALDAPAAIPAGWWIGSYSSLAHGTRHEGAALDHDLRAPELAAAPRPAAAALAADDILRFPRGAAAGECLHAVFEHIDFSGAAGWPAAIDAALRTHPPAPADELRGELPAMVARCVADVLAAPLPGGFTLGTVARSRRLVELEFNLPCRGLGAARLAGWLAAQGYAMPALDFGRLDGYLRGFIDLVFEHDGCFHVVDWKSNHLGDTAADYAAGPLARAMDRAGYHLQLLLYTVAVHRLLQRRLPEYRYERHFGGALYLFVRGVRPHWPGAGVHHHRPPRAVVEGLSVLLDGEEAAP